MPRRFQTEDRVQFVKTSDETLDGLVGTILGRSFVYEQAPGGDVYIVLFDQPPETYPDHAICMTEACLEKYEYVESYVPVPTTFTEFVKWQEAKSVKKAA